MSAKAAEAAKSAPLPLRDLNKRSAQFGSWTVVVQQAQQEEYEYVCKGKLGKGKSFSCLLVSPEDPSEYCMGTMRHTIKLDSKFQAVTQKFKDGLAFTMSAVAIVSDAKKQYVHSPIQLTVNLAETNMNPLLNSKNTACQHQPPAMIADCL